MEGIYSHLLLFSLLLISTKKLAFAADILGKGSNITDGETIVSSDGTFTMGFFSPGTSTKRYLGIWFSVSIDAVVWVANRERPVNDKAGALVVSDTGSLLLLDGFRQIAWSSNSTSTSPVEAQLLNSGNLVVRNRGSATILWQSFDYPSNAMLSGMKVGKDFWDGVEWFLTSWHSPDDPSPGAYRRLLDTSGLPDNVVWKGNAKTFRTGPWNGLWFSGIPEVLTYKNLIEYRMEITSRQVTYGYVVKPGAPLTYVVLTETGDVNRLVWDNGTRSWQTQYHGPRDICDNYGKCGEFGVCNASAASTSFCSCLKGFSPVSPSEWKVREASGGCQRNLRLDCGGKQPTTDGFELVHGVKLPDTHNASVYMDIAVEECRARCLSNCSCVAYAAADIRGGGSGSGCVIWADRLMDLRYVDGGQDLYLRLPRSELGSTPAPAPPPAGLPVKLIVVIASISTVVLLILLALICLIWTGRVNWRDIIFCLSLRCLATIRRATRNFSTNILGEGAFGIVYMGTLPRLLCLLHGLPRRTIAVKRLRPIPGLPEGIVKYFTREVEVMNVLRLSQHPNILRFIAYCHDRREHILVYEYMDRGSLESYIFNGDLTRRVLLNWQRRLEIIIGIAQGVNHLHEGVDDVIILHRDLKPENVLLDDGWNVKVADFGTAKLLLAGAEGVHTRIGTPEYMAPEYVLDEDQTTLKCDVYSFGVTLLETLSGRRNNMGLNSLISYAWELWDEINRDIMDLLDPVVTPPPAELVPRLRRCIQIGLLCVQGLPENRPSMSEVVRMLNDNILNLAPPRAPMVQLPDELRVPDATVPIDYAIVSNANLRWQHSNGSRLLVAGTHDDAGALL